MAHEDYVGLIAACAKYGDLSTGGDPQLWADVLEYLCTRTSDCTSEVRTP